jgi:SAM-dependent methyltransferase
MSRTLGLLHEQFDRADKFTILDAGCGLGIYTINIMKQFPNCTAYGFDISKTQIDFVNEEIRKLGMGERSHFFESDIEEFSVNNRFDVIICTEVIEHLPNPEIALKNLLVHGAPDAVYLFSVPIGVVPAKHVWFYRQFLNSKKWTETPYLDDIDQNKEFFEFYHKQYTRPEIISLLLRYGFEINKIRFSGFKPLTNKYVVFANGFFPIPIGLDKFFNAATKNIFSSQITIQATKADC